MSSRNFVADGTSKSHFSERKALRTKSNDGFFIKPSKNPANQRNNQGGPQKKFRVKEKQVNSVQDTIEPKTKTKSFDKKSWRFKRYSKKYKLEQWKDIRKTQILRGFDKSFHNRKSSKFNFEEDKDHTESTAQKESLLGKQPYNDDSTNDNTEVKSTKLKPYVTRKKKFKSYQMNEETNDKQAAFLKQKAEKEEAIKEYKRKKLEKFKKLTRKTKKGQPVMKGRIEVLLEEIQNSIKN